jgi:integrase
LKFDVGVGPAGKRATRYHSFKGTKREAQAELVRLLAAADRREYVDPSRATVAEFLDRWEGWIVTQVSAKTIERYRELLAHHVRPHLGARRIQRLRPVDLAELYGKLQHAKPDGAGLSARTVGHVHRLLHRVLSAAVKWTVIPTNPAALAEAPRVERTEVEILTPDQVGTALRALRGRPLYPVAVVAIATGMRRGELTALRWNDVDLDAGKIRVERSLEQTNAGLAFKAPKTKAGRRTVSIPPSIVAELREHWLQQQEQRLALGLGRADRDDLAFARADGSPWPPDSLTTAWQKTIAALKLPKITLHSLRHTHVSQLIAAGLDVVTVSRRIGHSNPTVTLSVYAHLFGDTDERAAAAVETALARTLTLE